jgi:acetate kinase
MILVINAGSSTLKFSLYRVEEDHTLPLLFHGLVDAIGRPVPRLSIRDGQGAVVEDRALEEWEAKDHHGAFAVIARFLARPLHGEPLRGVGHRVVHGGWQYSEPVTIDDEVLSTLDSLVPLAPLHQPHALSAIRAVTVQTPGVRQVACFDTAFHHARPQLARMFALPLDLYDAGVRRYGFHGLSYESIADALPTVAPDIAEGRVIVAHLGNGASLCAMYARRSVETTMSFSALDGLPMGTRCGALDPAAVLYLQQARGMTPEEVGHLLYNKSGLLGLSGKSADVRDLLAAREPRSRLALAYLVYRIAQEVGALASSLHGLDGVVFTAGIGEHAALIRGAVCERLAWLGLTFDPAANNAHGPRISAPGSAVEAWVIPTDEERMIARHTLAIIEER